MDMLSSFHVKKYDLSFMFVVWTGHVSTIYHSVSSVVSLQVIYKERQRKYTCTDLVGDLCAIPIMKYIIEQETHNCRALLV